MKSFFISSGVIVASDPCYKIPKWCQGVIDNVLNGEWIASTVIENNRVKSLSIIHKEYSGDINIGSIEQLPFNFGVDSGQFGFFDKDGYRNDELAKDLPKEDFGEGYDTENGDIWYRAAAYLTLSSENQWGVFKDGVVSTSGYGDGSYDVYGMKNNEGKWIAFSVDYFGMDDTF